MSEESTPYHAKKSTPAPVQLPVGHQRRSPGAGPATKELVPIAFAAVVDGRVAKVDTSRHGAEQEAGALGGQLVELVDGSALTALIAAVRPHVAMTFDEAQTAADSGERLIFCQEDALNPCWAPGMPVTTPLRHWGWTPGMEGEGLACRDCRLRAAIAGIDGHTACA